MAQPQNFARPNVGAGYEMPEPGITIKFFKQAILMEHQTKIAQKANPKAMPIFDEVEMIEINLVGDKYSQIVQRADRYKHRWPAAYDRFLEGKGTPGLSLDNWDQITPSLTAAFNSRGIFTVEQLATLPETNISGTEHKYLMLAKAYVGSQDAVHQNRELNAKLAIAEENAQKREAALQAQLDTLTKALEAVSGKEVKHVKGKPAKAANTEEVEEEIPTAPMPQMQAPKPLPPHMVSE